MLQPYQHWSSETTCSCTCTQVRFSENRVPKSSVDYCCFVLDIKSAISDTQPPPKKKKRSFQAGYSYLKFVSRSLEISHKIPLYPMVSKDKTLYRGSPCSGQTPLCQGRVHWEIRILMSGQVRYQAFFQD